MGRQQVSKEKDDDDLASPGNSDRSPHTGAILADEMGLGKTLQVLAASWTLMHRGGAEGRPLVRKMLVVAPSSVIKNWGQEIKKWLGMERAPYLVLMPSKEAVAQVRRHSQLRPRCTHIVGIRLDLRVLGNDPSLR
jgi:SNF2 family DNA or RNA helicase